MRPVPSRPLLRSLLLAPALLTSLIGCGSAEKVAPPAFDQAGSPYQVECGRLSALHTRELADKKYIPVELLVHEWPQDVTPTTAKEAARAFLPEEQFVASLTGQGAPGSKHRIRTTLVMARGGTGKSKLAESITAQACVKTPVFRVDLNTEIAAHLDANPAGQNAIAVALGHQLKLDTNAGAEAAVRAALGARPFVVVLDSLDEVPLLQRQQVVTQTDDFVTRVADQARAIVMTRPPVFTSNYGLQTVDARLEIPQLTCSETDAAVARMVSEPADRKNFLEFVKRYGIDRQVTAFDRCYYPHMSTYRDLQVVQRLARNSSVDKETQDFKGFQSSRAQVYTYFATAQLLKDMQGLPILPSETLALIDRMVAAKKPANGERNLPFTLQECVAVAEGEAGNKQAVCERLLQSALYKSGEPGVFHFDNQSVGDLFLARWTAAQIEHDGRVDCTVVAKLADLLESNEVSGFLVGHPAGQACFAQVAVELTRRSGCAQNIVEMLDQGLPSGPDRKRILEVADKALAGLQPSVCVTGLMETLGKGLGVETTAPANGRPPLPGATPPTDQTTPAAKGKPAKKKGK